MRWAFFAHWDQCEYEISCGLKVSSRYLSVAPVHGCYWSMLIEEIEFNLPVISSEYSLRFWA